MKSLRMKSKLKNKIFFRELKIETKEKIQRILYCELYKSPTHKQIQPKTKKNKTNAANNNVQLIRAK